MITGAADSWQARPDHFPPGAREPRPGPAPSAEAASASKRSWSTSSTMRAFGRPPETVLPVDDGRAARQCSGGLDRDMPHLGARDDIRRERDRHRKPIRRDDARTSSRTIERARLARDRRIEPRTRIASREHRLEPLEFERVAKTRLPVDEIELRPCREHDVRRLGIEADVELGRHALGIAAAVDRAAHDDKPRDALRQRGIHAQRQREIRQRRKRDQRQLARTLACEPHDRARRVLFFGQARCRRITGVAEAVGTVHEARIRRIEHERARAAGKHRRVGVEHFDELQRIARRMREPDVAADDRQRDDVRVRVRHHDRERIVDAGIGVDDQLGRGHVRILGGFARKYDGQPVEPAHALRRREDAHIDETRCTQPIDDVAPVVAKREDALRPQRIDMMHRLEQVLDDAIAHSRALDRLRAVVQRYREQHRAAGAQHAQQFR